MNADMSIIVGSASFVLNSLLICLGVLIIIVTALVVDNLIFKYWKPIKFVWYVDQDPKAPRVERTENKMKDRM